MTSPAVQALLSCARELNLPTPLRLRALGLFVDRYLPAVSSKVVALEPLGPSSWQVVAAALGCMLLVMRNEGQQSEKSPVVRTYKAASKVLGPDFEALVSSRDLESATAAVQQSVGGTERRPDTISSLELYFSQLQEAGIKAFSGKSGTLQLETAYTILELLYSDGPGQFRGAVTKGGRLMAGAVMAAAYAIAAPLADAQTSLPFLSWLSDLCGYPKEVVKSQAATILQHVLA